MQDKTEMEDKIDEVIKRFKGKGGDEEAETILIDNNADKREGLVTVWGCNHNIAKVAMRCRKAIVECRVDEAGASLTIKRKAFRGVVYAFRNVR